MSSILIYLKFSKYNRIWKWSAKTLNRKSDFRADLKITRFGIYPVFKNIKGKNGMHLGRI